jgi:hypothetical protein
MARQIERHRSSRRTDELGIGEHVIPHARFQAVVRYEINLPPRRLLKIQHQPGMLDRAHFRVLYIAEMEHPTHSRRLHYAPSCEAGARREFG